jgi:hypothetical protein
MQAAVSCSLPILLQQPPPAYSPPTGRRIQMAAIAGIVILLLLLGLFFLFRAMGSMDQEPTVRERVRHSGGGTPGGGPRAPGLN